MDEEIFDLVDRGIKECERGDTLKALMYLQEASQKKRTPLLDSYLAYCLARERKSYSEAIKLGMEAVNEDPDDLVLYLNLAKVYILTGQRSNALKILRQATKRGRDERVIRMIKDMGIRKEPVLRFLDRSHPLNIFLGKLRYKFLG